MIVWRGIQTQEPRQCTKECVVVGMDSSTNFKAPPQAAYFL